jgi:hypothetical protein
MKMSEKAILTLFLRPSSIAIHDDGDMLWQAFFINQYSE